MRVAGHLHVDMATAERVSACLPEGPVHIASINTWGEPPDGKQDNFHPLGQWTLATTVENPAILYDDQASVCSPVITIDSAGNALHFHELFGMRDRTAAYYEALPGFVAVSGVTAAITATNKWLSRVNPGHPHQVDRIVDDVEAKLRQVFPDVILLPLISQQQPSQLRVNNLVPPRTDPCGFVFVPRYIAADERNHLFVIPAEEAGAIHGAVHTVNERPDRTRLTRLINRDRD